MTNYYVNKIPSDNQDHEVHKEECPWLPEKFKLTLVGRFSNCKEAVEAAKNHFKKANGCCFCNNKCFQTKH
ncbi:MAG: hypothetical protein OIF50_07165 [Flavobacteriaceae bacterium]|nr:hypothetical protein [Flavobacteriaceae bacterium]